MGKTDYYKEKKVAIIQLVCYTLIVMTVFFLISYMVSGNLNLLYLSVFCVLIHNILYGYSDLSKRLLFVFFHFTFFVFLMTKPFIAFWRGEEWWYTIYNDFSPNADIEKMLFCMLLSLVAIWLGAIIGERKRISCGGSKEKNDYRELLERNMHYIALTIFLLSGFFSYLKGYEKILYVRDHSYLEYYTGFHTRLPYIVRLIASFTKYSFCFYLATKPSKKQAFLPCMIFIILSIPDLIMGGRAEICLNILLVFFYYCLRDLWQDSIKWIGKVEKAIIFIASPIVLVFLGVYIDIRAQRSINFSTIPSAIVEFFNDQGISFSYMSAGLGNSKYLPENAHYTLGGIWDYLRYGSLGKLVGDGKVLDSSNSILRATQGNSYAHHMSYILLKEEYLEGRGIGSSYLNEIYTDYAYIGLFLLSIVIGFLLVYFVRKAKYSSWSRALLLLSFSGIIYIPRSEFTGFFDYITKMQFWFIVAAIYFSIYLFGRKYIYRRCRT